jgi:N-acetylneuraminic acid mutarotase
MRALLFAPVLAAMLVAVSPGWKRAAPVPLPRTEVSAARLGKGEIVVVGGFVRSGENVGRADAYSPGKNRWRRLPDLPVTVDHAAAASSGGRPYVLGGYGADRRPLASAFVFRAGAWRSLPSMPEPRAAAAAAVARGNLYVVGGIGPDGLATRALKLDLKTLRWSFVPGPTTRREHLAATALGGRVYALAGRTVATGNLDAFEVYTPSKRRWTDLPRLPETRGGTGAAAVGNTIVSVGGEARETIRTVYAYNVKKRRWSRLPDLPTPRHGLGVVAYRGRVYALAGGPQPGLFVSAANEYLRIG